ncbi:MAG TPA: 50S ribosomal protein L18Ae [Thermoplasmata archaeon]|jgi:ribosomal protein L20A (L18A)
MKAFEIKGQLRLSVRKWQRFSIEVASLDENAAVDKTLALMGSRHKVKRKFIKIEQVRSMKTEEVTDSAVKHMLEARK